VLLGGFARGLIGALMGRIIEFQPADEQTVVARVLLELHQAIDANFPDANQTNRQFAKTVLTSQNESTRIDGIPNPIFSRQNSSSKDQGAAKAPQSLLSMTPKSGVRKSHTMFGTDDIKTIMGQSTASRRVTQILWGSLVAGALVFLYLYFYI
jgi:hypothetical protein